MWLSLFCLRFTPALSSIKPPAAPQTFTNYLSFEPPNCPWAIRLCLGTNLSFPMSRLAFDCWGKTKHEWKMTATPGTAAGFLCLGTKQMHTHNSTWRPLLLINTQQSFSCYAFPFLQLPCPNLWCLLCQSQLSDFRSCFSPEEVEMKEKVLPPSSVQVSSCSRPLQIHSSFLEEVFSRRGWQSEHFSYR